MHERVCVREGIERVCERGRFVQLIEKSQFVSGGPKTIKQNQFV